MALALAAGLLAGCAGTPPNAPESATHARAAEPAAPTPADYRKATAGALRATLKDPGSVRSPQISPPGPTLLGAARGGPTATVCVRMNAKNSFGGYTGIQDTAVVFQHGAVVDIFGGYLPTCQGRRYEPFPELLPQTQTRR